MSKMKIHSKKDKGPNLDAPIKRKELLPIVQGMEGIQKALISLEKEMGTIQYHIQKHKLPGFESLNESRTEFHNWSDKIQSLYEAPLTEVGEILKNYNNRELLSLVASQWDLQGKLEDSNMDVPEQVRFLESIEEYEPSITALKLAIQTNYERELRVAQLNHCKVRLGNESFPVAFGVDPKAEGVRFLPIRFLTEGMNMQILVSKLNGNPVTLTWRDTNPDLPDVVDHVLEFSEFKFANMLRKVDPKTKQEELWFLIPLDVPVTPSVETSNEEANKNEEMGELHE